MVVLRTLAFVVVAGLAVGLPSKVVYGDEGTSLSYAAPDGCPSRADFVASVEARGARFDAAAPLARRLEVSIAKGSDGFTGSLRVDGADGGSGTREVHAAGCGEVADGLSVVAAIALGAHPEDAKPPAASETKPSAPAPAPAVPESPGRPTSPPRSMPPPTEEGRLRGTNFGTPKTLEVPAGTLRFERARSYQLAAGATYGVLPTVMPRFDLTLSIANFVQTPSRVSTLVGNVLQVAWSFLGPTTYETGGYSTRALGILAGVNSCSSPLYDTGGAIIMICAEFRVGAVGLETHDASGARTQTKNAGFGTGGISLDARYDIGSLVDVGLRLGGALQFGQISAERPDGTRLFASPLFDGYGLLGVGLHFQ